MKAVMTVLFLMAISTVSHAGSRDTGSIMTAGPWTTYSYFPDGTTDNSYSDTALFGTGVNDHYKYKLVMNSREDAAYFVASEGVAKTPMLKRAMEIVRTHVDGAAAANDMEIALFIAHL